MEFSEVLITYMKELHMTAKELAELTELSPSIISRYRSGQRVPAADSPQLDAIVRALGKRAKELEHPTLGKKAIRAAFEDTFSAKANAEAQLAPRLSTLMTTLGITQAAMARGCGYDPSQLSRIRKGQRLPADVEHFIDAVAAHISTNYTTTEDLQKLQSLMNVEGLSSKASVKNAIATWLHANDVTVYYVLDKPKKSEKKEKKKAEKTEKPEKTTKPSKSTKTEKTEAVEPKQETKKPVVLTDEEKEAIEKVKEIMFRVELIGCTACRYCVDGCPMRISIPDVISAVNTKRKFPEDFRPNFFYNGLVDRDGNGKSSACIGCGQCEGVCPQHLPIISIMKEAAEKFESNN